MRIEPRNCKKTYIDKNIFNVVHPKCNNRNLKLLYLNIQCLNTGRNELEVYLKEKTDIQIVCICEHWVSEGCKLQNISIDFSLASKFCRSQYSRGGVAIYIKKERLLMILQPTMKYFKTFL